VIVNYHGQPVEGTEQFTRLVQETPPGREVKLQIYRGGNPQTVTAKIGSHSAPQVSRSQAPFVLPLEPPRLQQGLRPATPSGGGGELGIQAIQVEGQLADYFGTKQGVLVASVVSGSPAEKAGLKAGDVITRAGDARIATPADVSNQIRMARGKSLSLTIVRDHREMTLNAPLDERF
jgi:serine protease Do